MAKRSLLFLILISVLVYSGCSGGGGGGGRIIPYTQLGSVSGTISSAGELSTTIKLPNTFSIVETNKTNSYLPASIPHEKIIRFRDGLTLSHIEQIVQSMGGKIKEKIYGPNNTYVISFANQSFKASTAIQNNSDIIYIEDNQYWHAFSVTPNDEFYESRQKWHYSMMFLPEAWSIQKGDNTVVVAVIDSGVYPHSDLVNNLDLDNAQDFVDGDSDPTDTDWDGVTGHRFSHGTHVAGIISADTNNNIGIAGVGWNVKIMPIRVLGPDGQGDLAKVVSGINWAVDYGAKVINLSIGGPNTNQAIADAIQYAEANNVTVVAAAGNESGPVCYPAKYETVIAVSALDHTGSLASYSNRGPEIDVCAPGGAAPIIDPLTQSIFSTTYDKQEKKKDMSLCRELQWRRLIFPGWLLYYIPDIPTLRQAR
ncbi:MAG: S8 family serine peptidase [Firmicutes bacterium]|nr:S8 family serine peptidase [Bacillota bacterium]